MGSRWDELVLAPPPVVSVAVEDQHGRVLYRPGEIVVVQGGRDAVKEPWTVRMDKSDGFLRGAAELWDGDEWLPVTQIDNKVDRSGDSEVTVEVHVESTYVPPRVASPGRRVDPAQAARRVRPSDTVKARMNTKHLVKRATADGDWMCTRCGGVAAEQSVLLEYPCPGDTIE